MTLTEVLGTLPARTGPRPRTGPMGAHSQFDQNGSAEFGEQLWIRMATLEDTYTGRSGISAPSTRAVHLFPGLALGPPAAFIIGTEFAHLHAAPDGSLHITLPGDAVSMAINLGWAELHPAARDGMRPPTLVMIYAPRDETELEAIWTLVEISYQFARGLQGRTRIS